MEGKKMGDIAYTFRDTGDCVLVESERSIKDRIQTEFCISPLLDIELLETSMVEWPGSLGGSVQVCDGALFMILGKAYRWSPGRLERAPALDEYGEDA